MCVPSRLYIPCFGLEYSWVWFLRYSQCIFFSIYTLLVKLTESTFFFFFLIQSAVIYKLLKFVVDWVDGQVVFLEAKDTAVLVDFCMQLFQIYSSHNIGKVGFHVLFDCRFCLFLRKTKWCLMPTFLFELSLVFQLSILTTFGCSIMWHVKYIYEKRRGKEMFGWTIAHICFLSNKQIAYVSTKYLSNKISLVNACDLS